MNDPTEEICAVVDRIRPLLAGRSPFVQGCVLADCLAMWLAGHPVELRHELLAMHIIAVRQLVDVNARIIGTPPGFGGEQPSQPSHSVNERGNQWGKH